MWAKLWITYPLLKDEKVGPERCNAEVLNGICYLRKTGGAIGERGSERGDQNGATEREQRGQNETSPLLKMRPSADGA